MSFIIHNGQFVEAHNASISIDDRGLLLGDGLFETMRAYQGKVFRMADHLKRLLTSCSDFNLKLPWTTDEISKMIQDLIEKNGRPSARVRLTITRGRHQGSMGLAPSNSPTLIITAEKIPAGLEDKTAKTIKLITPKIRFSENNFILRHKSLNRLMHLWARAEAEKAGADEALILDERSNVASCSTGNIFAVQYGQLFTPPLTAPILPGVTRKVVIELAHDEGIPVREDFFSPIMLAGADEAFITNCVQEILPVVEANGRRVASGKPGPVAMRLRELYRRNAMNAWQP